MTKFFRSFLVCVGLLLFCTPAFPKASVMRFPSGTGVLVPTQSGNLTSGNCVKSDANGNVVDSGSVCGSGGTGDVVGPATNTDGYIPLWNGTNSKTLKSGIDPASKQASSSILSALAGLTYVSGSPRVIMTGAAAFGLDSTVYLTAEVDPIVVSQTNGFTITRGTTPATLTVASSGSVSGTNTGDNAANSTYTIGSQTQAYNSHLTGINQELTTTSSPSFTAVGATTFTGALTGTASGNLTSAAIGSTVQAYNSNLTAINQALTTTSSPSFTTVTAALTGTASGNITSSVATLSSLTSANGSTIPASDTLVGRATTDTLTHKRITPRILSAASYTTDTGTSLNCDNLDQFIVTAQAGALKLNNPTGTPVDGQKLLVAITGTAARALTYDTQFEASTVALPTTTVTTARLNIGFIWRADTSKWVCVAAS